MKHHDTSKPLMISFLSKKLSYKELFGHLLLAFVFTFNLSGCVAALPVVAAASLAAPVALGAKVLLKSKPQMEYTITKRGRIRMDIETKSLNMSHVKKMVEIGAAMVAKKRGCRKIRLVDYNLKDNLIMSALKLRASATYECTSSSSHNIATVVDVDLVYDNYREVINTIETEHLLRRRS